MRHFYPLNDTRVSISLLMAWEAGAAGNTYRVTIPLEGLLLDNREEADEALFAYISALRTFVAGATSVTLLSSDVAPDGGPLSLDATEFEPMLDVVYTLQFLLKVAPGAGAVEDMLLTAYGPPIATAIPVPIEWPTVATAPGVISFTTIGGTPVPARIDTA